MTEFETDLILPGVHPDNLVLNGALRNAEVTGDVYRICERLAEINPRLYIEPIVDTVREEMVFCVMERTSTGNALVFKTRHLDARILNHVQYLLKVPFEQRLAEAEKLLEKDAAETQQDEHDELYEKFGGQMLRDLWRTGFIEQRNVSYPTIGVATGGKRPR